MTMDMHPRDEVKIRQNNASRRASGTFRSPNRTPSRRKRGFSDGGRKDAEGDVTSSEDDEIPTMSLVAVPEDSTLERITVSEPTSPQSKSITTQNLTSQRNRSASLATEAPQSSTAARRLVFDDESNPSVSSSSQGSYSSISSNSLFPLPQQAVELPFAAMGPTSAAAWTAAFSNLVSPRTLPQSRPPVWAQELFEAVEHLKRDLEAVKHLVPAFDGIERRMDTMSQTLESYEKDTGGEENAIELEHGGSRAPLDRAGGLDPKTLHDAVSSVAQSQVASAIESIDLTNVVDAQLEPFLRELQEKLEKSIFEKVSQQTSEAIQERLDEAKRQFRESYDDSIRRIPSLVHSQVADLSQEAETKIRGSVDAATASLQTQIKERLHDVSTFHVNKLNEERRAAIEELMRSSESLWARFDRGIQQMTKDRAEVSGIHDKILALEETLRGRIQDLNSTTKSVSALADSARVASENCESILCQIKSLNEEMERNPPTGSAAAQLDHSSIEALSEMSTSIGDVSLENQRLKEQVSVLSKRLNELEKQISSDRPRSVAAALAPAAMDPSTERVLPKDFAKMLLLGCIALILLLNLLIQHPPERLSGFM